MNKYLKDKTIIIGGLVTVASIMTAVFISIIRKKKMIKQLEAKIASGESTTGTFTDLANSKAFDTTYWKTVTGATLLPVAKALTYAKRLLINYDVDTAMDSGKFTKAEAQAAAKISPLDTFKMLKNQAQVSQVVFYYNQFGGNLYDDMAAKKNTFGHIVDFFNKFDVFDYLPNETFAAETNQIYDYVKSLPLK